MSSSAELTVGFECLSLGDRNFRPFSFGSLRGFTFTHPGFLGFSLRLARGNCFQISTQNLKCVCSHMCTLTWVLSHVFLCVLSSVQCSYVCLPTYVCSQICVLSNVCALCAFSHVCSCMCALTSVLLYVCSHRYAHICVLSCVCVRVNSYVLS